MNNKQEDYISISTITPVYNGAKYLENLVQLLTDFEAKLRENYPQIILAESIFVIDECIDNSLEVLERLKKTTPFLKIITLSNNFGQHPATVAGILYSSGNWVVTLDEDCQHNPMYIDELLKKLITEKADICYANPTDQIHKSMVRDTVSIWYKQMMEKLTNTPNIQYFNSYRILRGSIARAAAAVCRNETYFDIALSWFSKRVTHLKIDMVDDRNQNNEKSSYSLWGLIRHAKRMAMSSKIKLLRGGLLIGILTFVISILFIVYAITSWFFDIEVSLVRGWTSTFVAQFFFGGLLTLLLGFTLESITDTLIILKGKPTFFVVDRSEDVILEKILFEKTKQDELVL